MQPLSITFIHLNTTPHRPHVFHPSPHRHNLHLPRNVITYSEYRLLKSLLFTYRCFGSWEHMYKFLVFSGYLSMSWIMKQPKDSSNNSWTPTLNNEPRLKCLPSPCKTECTWVMHTM